MKPREALRAAPVGYHLIVLLEKDRWNLVTHALMVYRRHGGQKVRAFMLNALRAQNAILPMS